MTVTSGGGSDMVPAAPFAQKKSGETNTLSPDENLYATSVALLYQRTDSLLDFNLTWLSNDNFRCASIILDQTRHADLFVAVLRLWVAKLHPITAPN